ncbi:Transglycosylase SLT domain [Prauserella sp. Am3]|nr:Transglycosylase SLT domain [Prauserella sp. Am3]
MDRPRRVRFRDKTASIVLAASLAVVPAALLSDRSEHGYNTWTAAADDTEPRDAGGANTEGRVGVDGSLPSPPQLEELVVEMPAEGPLGIPGTMLEAYRQAADRLSGEVADCGIDWALLASIGRSESNHARGGYVDGEGTTREPILGPVLNGGPGVAEIRDTDGGEFDGDTTWDRAVGPMQFIPSTWRAFGADATGSGTADPNNIHDATLAAGRYLCAGGPDLRDGQQLRAALHRYNNSRSYVETVIRWAQAYRDGVLPIPDSDVPLGVPPEVVAAAPRPEAPQTSKPEKPDPTPRPGPGSDVIAAPGPGSPGSDRPGGERPGGGGSGDHSRPGGGSGGDGRPGGGSGGDGRPGGGSGDGGTGQPGGGPGGGDGSQSPPPSSPGGTPPTDGTTPPGETTPPESPSPTEPPSTDPTEPDPTEPDPTEPDPTEPDPTEPPECADPEDPKDEAAETPQESTDAPEPPPCRCPEDVEDPDAGETVDDPEKCWDETSTSEETRPTATTQSGRTE